MSFVICLLVIVAFGDVSSLKCYKCDANRAEGWVDAGGLPPFMDDCAVVDAEKQCSSSIRWLTLGTLKETLVEYEGDVDEQDRPKDSSLSYASVNIKRDPRSASSRIFLFSCTTDRCNDRTSLLKAFQALTLEENFAPLDSLVDNRGMPFTEQSSCFDTSNSTSLNCPPTAAPLLLCSNCLLLSLDSPREICARCPADGGKDNNVIHRQVYFFLENRTRLADRVTVRCMTTACNSIGNWQRVQQLSKIDFDFNKFSPSSASVTSHWAVFWLLNLFVFLSK